MAPLPTHNPEDGPDDGWSDRRARALEVQRWTSRRLAIALGYNPSTVSRVVRNGRGSPLLRALLTDKVDVQLFPDLTVTQARRYLRSVEPADQRAAS